ncbi:hypothetical protein LAZ67_3002654 [Cordylochernes scorpioides]|uniref:Transposase n=1 Tax=Cordylochernes scorpioides TaxID=51811 RepID=A0ABY6K855_9ARAC|nr:hypothetical protein LAZ67_3002654 [Cordylochernes scorpioides]
MVRRWRSWFLEGRQNVHDDERSGRPVTATDNAAVAAVRNVVEADRRVIIDEIMIRLPPRIKIGRSSIGTIMSDVLSFRKVWARWVPRLLSENHKQQRMEAARAFLEMHRRDGDQLFSRIVTGDESWVHYSTPETKRQSMVWKKPEESAPKKAKVTISAGKVMAIVFWDSLKLHLGGKHFENDDEVCRRRRTTGYEERTRLGTTVVSKNRYNGTKNVWREMAMLAKVGQQWKYATSGRLRSTKGNNRTGGQSNCQNGCRSTGIHIIYHPTCDRHTSVQNDRQQATERAESKSSPIVTMPTPHTRAPTSPTTVVSGVINLELR